MSSERLGAGAGGPYAQHPDDLPDPDDHLRHATWLDDHPDDDPERTTPVSTTTETALGALRLYLETFDDAFDRTFAGRPVVRSEVPDYGPGGRGATVTVSPVVGYADRELHETLLDLARQARQAVAEAYPELADYNPADVGRVGPLDHDRVDIRVVTQVLGGPWSVSHEGILARGDA